MTASSNQSKVIKFDPDAYDMYNPIDCATAFVVKNNLAHLTDESCQTRINWVSSGADTFGFLGLGPIVWHQTVMWTWLAANKPANADIYVRALVDESRTLTLRARLVPNSYPLGDTSAPAILDASGTTTSGTIATVIDTQQIVDSSIVQSLWTGSRLKTNPGDVDPIKFPTVSKMRLEIHCTTNIEPEDGSQIVGVYLREFA